MYKMEEYNNNMTIAKLRALAREHGLKGYSRLRKAELITFLLENLWPPESVERMRARLSRPMHLKSLELLRKTHSKPMSRSKPT